MAPPGALARTLVELRKQHRTGRLLIDSDGTRTFVYLREGVPIFAEEDSSGETLGRLLVRLGMLSQQQYVEVLSTMTDALVFNEQIRFGETVVELGYLSESTVLRALEDQTRWKVIRCFQRVSVEWSFEDGEHHVEDVRDFPMVLEALVYQATLWLDSERRLELGLRGVLDTFVVLPAGERSAFADRLDQGEAPRGLFAQMDGTHSVRELIAAPEESDLDREAALTTVVMLGAARFHPTPQLGKSAPEPARPPAPAPPPTRPPSAPPVLRRAHASQVLRQLSSMVRSLKADDQDLFKEPASEHERRLLAEHSYQRGREHLAAGRTMRAQWVFQRAKDLDPGNAEYGLLSAFAEIADRLDADTKARGGLEAAAARVAKLDPNLAYAHYVLGRCAFADGDFNAAARHLTRAVNIDPQLTEAQRHLRIAIGRRTGA